MRSARTEAIMKRLSAVAASALLLASFFIISVTCAVAQTPTRLTEDQKREGIAGLAKLLRARYAIEELAEPAARAVEERLASGAYDGLTDPREFGEAVTRDLQAVTKDPHLRFGVAPPPPPPPAAGAKPPDAAAVRAAQAKYRRQGNYGFPKAEILPGDVGYLRVDRFQSPDEAVDTLNGVMAFLANTDAVIVDLRSCTGGNAHMMPWFAGYFVSRPTSLFDMVFRGDNVTERYWTQPWLPGRRLDHQPMYILTSAHTFSGAEAFAYRFQVLKRATIVGETTRGGANAGGVLDIPPRFAVWMPMGRPVDQDTGTNWEGTGVVPDVKAAARDALVVAHLAALARLKAEVTDPTDLKRLDWAIEQAEGRRHPVSLDEAAMGRLAGSYGTRRVWVEGGQLRYQLDTRPIVLLTPVTATVFAPEAYDPIRVEFILGPDGRATAIDVFENMWEHARVPRSR